ncbi:MAG: TRAP transporter substrate-binding protein DctP [Clostridia bacterium]|nr:TRAP transporter substrate-binding protein DctP [Clostridia bacterium]
MKKNFFILIVIIALVLFSTVLLLRLVVPPKSDSGHEAKDAADAAIILRIGHDAPPEHSLQQALLLLQQSLERQSNGRMRVELYPYYEAGEDAELVGLTAEGALQMCLPLSSSLAALPPKDDAAFGLDIPKSWQQWGALDGFFPYADADAALAALDGETGAALKEALADLPGRPLLCLGWAADGPLNLASSAVEIRRPGDLSGQKVAVSGSGAWLAAFRKLGAEPQPLSPSEIYPAMMKQQASVCQTTPEYILSLYVDDYATSMTLTEHAWAFRPILINRQWYEDLAAGDADLLRAVLAEFMAERAGLADSAYTASIEQLRQRGMQVIELSDAERSLWREAGQ